MNNVKNQYIVFQTNECLNPPQEVQVSCANGECHCTQTSQFFNRINKTCEACPQDATVSSDGLSCDCQDKYIKFFNQKTKKCEYTNRFSCQENQYFNEYTGKCSPCPTGAKTEANTGVKECQCPENQYWSWKKNTCLSCPDGSEIDLNSKSNCRCVGNNKIYSEKDNKCKECPSGSIYDYDTCKCSNSSLTFDDESWSCQPCPEGEEMKDEGYCDCKKGYVTIKSHYEEYCRKCPKSSDDYSCKCDDDEIFDFSTFTCIKCVNGKDTYKICKCNENEYFDPNDYKCKTLPANTIKNQYGGYTCNKDFYKNDDGLCAQCPQGSTSKDGITCECTSGYLGISCQPCGDNGYSEGDSERCECVGDFDWSSEHKRCEYDGKGSDSNSYLIQLSLCLSVLMLIL